MIRAHLVCRAAAAPRRMAVPSAFAGVHCTHEHEVCRKGLGPGNARYGDLAVLKRLTQHLEHVLAKLRQLIEKQHAVVCKADLARARNRSAAGHCSARNGVVRRTERACGDDRVILTRKSCDGVDLRGFKHFLARHIRQYAGQALAHHALAGAWRPDHEYVVSAGGGNLHSTLYVLLTLDIGKIKIFHRCRVELRYIHRLYAKFSPEMRNKLGHILDGIHRHALGIGGFLRVIGRHEQLAHALARGGDRHGQRTADRPQRSVERKLAEKCTVGLRLAYHASCGKNAKHYRQIVYRSGLFRVRRRKIDCDAADREFEAV